MPIYEYKCQKCGHEFEELVRNNRQKIVCTKCEGKVDRKMSTFSAVVSSPAEACENASMCPQGTRCGGGPCSLMNG